MWLWWAALALVVYAVWGFLPNQTRAYLDSESAVVYEAIGGVVCALTILLVAKLAVKDFNLHWHNSGAALGLVTGACLVLGGYAYLQAQRPDNLASVVTLTSLYPALTVVAGACFFGKDLSLVQWIGLGLAIVGVILVCSRS